MATRVAGERRRQGQWQQKANNNQPATRSTKVGGGWRESVNKATTQPRRWAMTNDDSMRRMMIAATKRARVARVMVTAMRVPVDEDGEGDNKKNGGGNEGGMRQRGRWQRRQEQWQQGWRASDGDKGDGDRRQTTINQRQDQQRRVVAGKRASTRQPHDHDGGRRRTTIACGG